MDVTSRAARRGVVAFRDIIKETLLIHVPMIEEVEGLYFITCDCVTSASIHDTYLSAYNVWLEHFCEVIGGTEELSEV